MRPAVKNIFYPLPFVLPRLWRHQAERTPQEISPELFINTTVPQGFDFSGEYALPGTVPVIPAETVPNVPVAPVPFQIPAPETAALYGAGFGGLTGAGLGLLITGGVSGAVGGGLLGAGIGGAAAPFVSPYLVAKLNEVYGRQ